jgi:hypothetical protein
MVMPPEKLDAQTIDNQHWMPFQFLGSLHPVGRGWRANNSRGCVKTVLRKFGNDQFLDMVNFDEMSWRIQWSKNEFSHSLSPEPTLIMFSVTHSRFSPVVGAKLFKFDT